MTAQQLATYLRRRADHHRDAAAECDLRREQASWSASSAGSADPVCRVVATWPGWHRRPGSHGSTDELDQHAAEHRRRQAALLFLGEHVIANEIYRLDRSDLQFLEMVPRDGEEQGS